MSANKVVVKPGTAKNTVTKYESTPRIAVILQPRKLKPQTINHDMGIILNSLNLVCRMSNGGASWKAQESCRNCIILNAVQFLQSSVSIW